MRGKQPGKGETAGFFRCARFTGRGAACYTETHGFASAGQTPGVRNEGAKPRESVTVKPRERISQIRIAAIPAPAGTGMQIVWESAPVWPFLGQAGACACIGLPGEKPEERGKTTMRKRQFLRLMAALLAVLLVLGTPAALAGDLPDAPQGRPAPKRALPLAQEVLEQCLAAYGGKAADWEELSAIYAALAKGDYTKGVSLEEVTLPTMPEEPSSALFQALMTGDLEAARQAAETLVREGELADPGYGYGYALNLLAVEAWNRSAEVPLSYDRQQAADRLLGYRYEGGPGYGYSYDGSTRRF